MIQPQELRIGNYLYYKVFPNAPESYEIIEVTSISKNGFISFINDEGKEETYYLDSFEKITLTEEILLKFGFEVKGSFWFVKSGIKIEKRNSGFSYFRFREEIKILSIHQLQNLYFSLTEKEVTFKN